jgi:cell division protein FtsQ
LSGVAAGDTLYRLDPEMIAGRILMHPWIERAHVTRIPTGVLSVRVEERTPVALSVSAAGQPVFYLDRSGESLPVDSVSWYDVPLVRGIANGTRPVTVRDTSTIELLQVLSTLPPSVDGLLSDLIVRPDGEVDAVTVPVHDGACIRVRLGRGDYDRKMKTLRAFWTQAVAGHPEKRIEWIDLRFEGQVVTKEESVIS